MPKEEFSVKSDQTVNICLSLRESVLKKLDILTARANEKDHKASRSNVANQLLSDKLADFNL